MIEDLKHFVFDYKLHQMEQDCRVTCISNYTFRLVTKQCGIHYDTMIVPFIPFAEWMVQ
jgi:hypothetical protein